MDCHIIGSAMMERLFMSEMTHDDKQLLKKRKKEVIGNIIAIPILLYSIHLLWETDKLLIITFTITILILLIHIYRSVRDIMKIKDRYKVEI